MSSWHPNQPYNDLPPLPPAAVVETRPVLKQCIAARAALAELKQAAALIPNQGVLINALPLLEAQASSEIENIVTTTDRLFQYQRAEAYADPATREALRHSSALLEGFQALKRTPLKSIGVYPNHPTVICLALTTPRPSPCWMSSTSPSS